MIKKQIEVRKTTMGKIFQGLFVAIIIIGLGLFIYAQKETKVEETSEQKVERIYSFYTNSGYVEGYDYDDDIMTLQWIKQKELDALDYQQTYQYLKTQKVENEFITRIDEVIANAKELKKLVPVPAYLQIDSNLKSKEEKQELNFINLLK